MHHNFNFPNFNLLFIYILLDFMLFCSDFFPLQQKYKCTILWQNTFKESTVYVLISTYILYIIEI